MAKITIKDLPEDYKISPEELKRIRGGLLSTSPSLNTSETITTYESTYKVAPITSNYKW